MLENDDNEEQDQGQVLVLRKSEFLLSTQVC
jgi:hypothetical protein